MSVRNCRYSRPSSTAITTVKTALSSCEMRSAPSPPPGANATTAARARTMPMLRAVLRLTLRRLVHECTRGSAEASADVVLRRLVGRVGEDLLRRVELHE